MFRDGGAVGSTSLVVNQNLKEITAVQGRRCVIALHGKGLAQPRFSTGGVGLGRQETSGGLLKSLSLAGDVLRGTLRLLAAYFSIPSSTKPSKAVTQTHCWCSFLQSLENSVCQYIRPSAGIGLDVSNTEGKTWRYGYVTFTPLRPV